MSDRTVCPEGIVRYDGCINIRESIDNMMRIEFEGVISDIDKSIDQIQIAVEQMQNEVDGGLASIEEDCTIAALCERAIHVGEHGGELNE